MRTPFKCCCLSDGDDSGDEQPVKRRKGNSSNVKGSASDEKGDVSDVKVIASDVKGIASDFDVVLITQPKAEANDEELFPIWCNNSHEPLEWAQAVRWAWTNFATVHMRWDQTSTQGDSTEFSDPDIIQISRTTSMPLCRQTPASRTTPQPVPAPAPKDDLEVGLIGTSWNGERVRVQGLKSALQHNGKEGTVQEYLTESGRFQVALDSGEVISVINVKLRPIGSARLTTEGSVPSN